MTRVPTFFVCCNPFDFFGSVSVNLPFNRLYARALTISFKLK